MDKINMTVDPKAWLEGIFIEGEYKELGNQKSQIFGGLSLKEAEEFCLISREERIPRYCEDTGERLD